MGENAVASSVIAEVVPKATFVENVQAYVKGTVYWWLQYVAVDRY